MGKAGPAAGSNIPAKRVLIADDSEILRRHLRSILAEIPGIVLVAEAATTEEAISAVQHHKPDLVILDIRMPGEGGINALKTIRELAPHTQVIIFTDYPYPQYRKKCLEEGTSYFFEKSTELEKMIELIRQFAKS